jgi:hypothetical protein
MKNKFIKIIALVMCIFSASYTPAMSSSDQDPESGAVVGGGILTLCQPTENKACVYMDIDTITVRVRNAGTVNEYLYSLDTCQENWRGNKTCNFNSLTINADNIQIVNRNRDEYTVGKERVYVNLTGRVERTILNGQMVPLFYHLNIGKGRVGTTDTKFSLKFGDDTLAFGSDTVRRTGVRYFMASSLPYKQYSLGPIPRANLIHKILVNLDPRKPNFQEFTLDIGTIIVKIIHTNALPLDLGNVNNGAGPAGTLPPNPNPSPDPNSGTFEMNADGDTFIFRSTVAATLTQIRSILAGTSPTNINNAHIEGEIVEGNKPYNPNWGFHLNETSIAVFTGTDYSCDGSAKVINRNLANVGSPDFLFAGVWCPNTSKLIREVF